MIEFIIGVCAFIFGATVGFVFGTSIATKTFCHVLGISMDDFPRLKTDLRNIKNQIKNTKVLTEDEKDSIIKLVFDTLMKYSKYKHNDTVCVTIAHED